MKIHVFLLLILCNIQLISQISTDSSSVPDPMPFGKSINQPDLLKYLTVLASDSLQGRETGTRGDQMAAEFIAQNFEVYGLHSPLKNDTSNPYYQSFSLIKHKIESGFIEVNARFHEHRKDLFFFSGDTQGDTLETELVFMGNGSAENYHEVSVKGKAVLAIGTSRYDMEKAAIAEKAGAAAFLLVYAENNKIFNNQLRMFKFMYGRPTHGLPSHFSAFPKIGLSPAFAANLLGITEEELALMVAGERRISSYNEDDFIPTTIKLSVAPNKEFIPTQNVVSFVEGTDFPEEVIVITAHYDHLGKKGKKIYYGADDNGSGVSALLEIAEAFALAEKANIRPKRSVLFMALAAEEVGLLGSEYYTEHPIFPIDKTVTNLNMDMVGHLDDAHPTDPRFVSVVGSDWLSRDLHEVHEAANNKYVNFEMDYTYNAKDHPEQFYYRSDQYNFAQFGIPVIFYTSGDHEDYHKPSDTISKITFERLEGVAQLVFYTAWEIAFREKKLTVDKESP